MSEGEAPEEAVGDLLLKYLRDNIVELCELIEDIMGDVEQAIVTANGDVLSKVVAAKLLGEIAEDLSMLKSAALCVEDRSALINVMLDMARALLRTLFDLKAGRPLDEVERELRGLQLTLNMTVDRLIRTGAQVGETGGERK